MASQYNRKKGRPALLIEEVRADIAYYRRRIHEAGPEDCAARRDVQDAYAPFLDRRLALLTMLTGEPADEFVGPN